VCVSMLPVALKNHLMRRISEFEATRTSSNMGRKRKLNTAQVLDRIFFVCKTGCQWSSLPVENASFKTVYHYFAMWSRARLFEDVFYRCVREANRGWFFPRHRYQLCKECPWCGHSGRNPTDRGRRATKVSLLCNEWGTPLCAVFHRANKNDCLTLKHTLDTYERKVGQLSLYDSLLADKGYDSETCRSICKQHMLSPLIPRRRSSDIFHGRYVVEQTFGLLDQFRRVRVRYETLGRNFKSFHFLALAVIVARRNC